MSYAKVFKNVKNLPITKDLETMLDPNNCDPNVLLNKIPDLKSRILLYLNTINEFRKIATKINLQAKNAVTDKAIEDFFGNTMSFYTNSIMIIDINKLYIDDTPKIQFLDLADDPRIKSILNEHKMYEEYGKNKDNFLYNLFKNILTDKESFLQSYKCNFIKSGIPDLILYVNIIELDKPMKTIIECCKKIDDIILSPNFNTEKFCDILAGFIKDTSNSTSKNKMSGSNIKLFDTLIKEGLENFKSNINTYYKNYLETGDSSIFLTKFINFLITKANDSVSSNPSYKTISMSLENLMETIKKNTHKVMQDRNLNKEGKEKLESYENKMDNVMKIGLDTINKLSEGDISEEKCDEIIDKIFDEIDK